MKTLVALLILLVNIAVSGTGFAQTDAPAQKMSVTDRMAKARAAKAAKKNSPAIDKQVAPPGSIGSTSVKANPTPEKATPADYKAPVDNAQHGPNGEVVRTGERGGKYYINKNGNKTYLKSNQ